MKAETGAKSLFGDDDGPPPPPKVSAVPGRKKKAMDSFLEELKRCVLPESKAQMQR